MYVSTYLLLAVWGFTQCSQDFSKEGSDLSRRPRYPYHKLKTHWFWSTIFFKEPHRPTLKTWHPSFNVGSFVLGKVTWLGPGSADSPLLKQESEWIETPILICINNVISKVPSILMYVCIYLFRHTTSTSHAVAITVEVTANDMI